MSSEASRKDVGVNIRQMLANVPFPDVDLLTGWPAKKFAALKDGEKFTFDWNGRKVIVRYDRETKEQDFGSTILEGLTEFHKECRTEGCHEDEVFIRYNRIDQTEFWTISHIE